MLANAGPSAWRRFKRVVLRNAVSTRPFSSRACPRSVGGAGGVLSPNWWYRGTTKAHGLLQAGPGITAVLVHLSLPPRASADIIICATADSGRAVPESFYSLSPAPSVWKGVQRDLEGYGSGRDFHRDESDSMPSHCGIQPYGGLPSQHCLIFRYQRGAGGLDVRQYGGIGGGMGIIPTRAAREIDRAAPRWSPRLNSCAGAAKAWRRGAPAGACHALARLARRWLGCGRRR